MTTIVDRTCTEARWDEKKHSVVFETVRLNDLRSASAYVLLGDPGMGKSTILGSEWGVQSDLAVLLDARDFLSFDLDSHHDWQGKTLFIDGLDEVRAGLADVRSVLDQIRHRLDGLGRPKFRISCREADWLGDNDRNRLESVSPDSTVRVLRLDPLSDDEIEQLLGGHSSVSDPRTFIDTAQQRGVSGLLANPQTLNMLADVAGGGDQWPESRRDTFDRACQSMARETNKEHAFGSPQPPLDEILYDAGHLCAAQLITGSAGFSLDPGDADYLSLDGFGDIPMDVAKAAVSTQLFRSVGERRFAAIHRHIAEFLGAHHLAERINDGLSARRVISLISGSDGIVVTEMRGLSGWLAALCPLTRELLTDRDPVGVALYGDLAGFSNSEKLRLLNALGSRAALMRLGFDTRTPKTATMLAPLCAPDMEPNIVEILSRPSRDPEHQSLVQLVLTLLWRGSPLAKLAPLLLDIVRDESRLPSVRFSAVGALIRTKPAPNEGTEDLEDLLEEIRHGVLIDPQSGMTGALLHFLYPSAVPARRVWDYLAERTDQHFIGRDSLFWGHELLEQSSDQDVAVLLDELSTRATHVNPALDSHSLGAVPTQMLARGLKACGDNLPIPQLYGWLSAVMPSLSRGDRPEDGSVTDARDWLERRPEVQQDLMLHGLSLRPGGERIIESKDAVFGPLLGSSLPVEFGSWCLEQAVRLAPSAARASEFLLDQAFESYRNDCISLDVLRTRIAGVEALEERLSARLRSVTPPHRPRTSERRLAEQAKQKSERQQGIKFVRQQAAALRENQAPLSLLHDLGRAYFPYPVNQARPLEPIDRIADLLGGDNELVHAALAGLRGSLWRGDLPELDEIIRLSQSSHQHLLAYPVQAGLDLLQKESPERLLELSERQIRAGLALYYCTPGNFSREPAWHQSLAKLRPEIVVAVATETAIAALRRRDGHSPALHTLANICGHLDLKRQALLKVLSKFPLRARLESLHTLDFLLWKVLDHPNEAALLQLLDSKLANSSMSVAQRVHWLAAGVVAAPEQYIERLTQLVRAGERRARHLTDFFHTGDPFGSEGREFSAATLQVLIELMGPSFAPDSLDESGVYIQDMEASGQIERFIRQLGAVPNEDATQALTTLTADQGLSKWSNHIGRALDNQRILHREATFSYPDLEQLGRVLDNGEPANAGDLAALVIDRLARIAADIHSSNANVWRQFWNEGPHNRPTAMKHENSCRDVLLNHLRRLLPQNVDAQPEGHYVGDKRSDIRVACSDFNVPVEIKKVDHRYIWSALRTQLIGKYTRDAKTSGYGIYLVLWFADANIPPPPEGMRPTTPNDLEDRLKQTLTGDEALKVSVVVLDVSQVR